MIPRFKPVELSTKKGLRGQGRVTDTQSKDIKTSTACQAILNLFAYALSGYSERSCDSSALLLSEHYVLREMTRLDGNYLDYELYRDIRTTLNRICVAFELV